MHRRSLAALLILALGSGCPGHRGELLVFGALATVGGVVVTAQGIDSYSPGSNTAAIGLGLVMAGAGLVIAGLVSGPTQPTSTPSGMIRRR